MNKDAIYKIIGYNGEYSPSVKKNIRKLLKENHPDSNGDREVFELICKVKDELENNKVSYNYDKNIVNNVNNDIDYHFCYKMINDSTRKKKIYIKNLEEKTNQLHKCLEEYNDNYHKKFDLETYLLSNSQLTNKLNLTKILLVIMLFIDIIVFIISIVSKNILFLIVFAILSIICLLTINKSFIIMSKIVDNSKRGFKGYNYINKKLKDNKKNQEQLNKEINKLNKIINNYENDLRFYNNIVNNRGI